MYKRILMAYDGSEAGQNALLECKDLMQWTGAALTLVAVMASLGASMGLWLQAHDYLAFAAFALWMGLSYGGSVSLMPALCMDFFGNGRGDKCKVCISCCCICWHSLLCRSRLWYNMPVLSSITT